MARKRKMLKSKAPQYYKFTECRVEGHHWTPREGYPKRESDGHLLLRSDCTGCGAVRTRVFDYRGLTVSPRSHTMYPEGYLVKGGMERLHFVLKMASDNGVT